MKLLPVAVLVLVGCGGGGGGTSAPDLGSPVTNRTIIGRWKGVAADAFGGYGLPAGVAIRSDGSADATVGGFKMVLQSTEYTSGTVTFTGTSPDGEVTGVMLNNGKPDFTFTVTRNGQTIEKWRVIGEPS